MTHALPHGDTRQGFARDFRVLFGLQPIRILKTLWQRRWTILGVFLLSVGLAWGILTQITPTYTASTKILIEGRKTRIVDLHEVLTTLQPQMATVLSEVEVFSSDTLARRVADQLNLYKDPDFNPSLRPAEESRLGGALMEMISGAVATVTGKPDAVELSPEEQDRRMRNAVVARVRAGLTVEAIRQSLVIRLTYRSPDPARAAQMVNAYAEAYIDQQLEAKFEAVRRASIWLNSRMSDLRATVLESESAVEAYRSASGLVGARGGQLAAQQKLTELNSQLVIAKSKRSEQAARVARVEATLRSGRNVDARDEVLSSQLIARLKEQEATLSRQMSEQGSLYGARHPLLLKTQSELADIRRKIDGEIQTQIQSLRNELEVLREREQALDAEARALEAKVLDQNKAEVKLRELEREAQANRALYETFLSRVKETGEQEQIQQADARVISQAEPPRAPSSPRRTLILLLAGIVGLVGGSALVLVLEHFNAGIRTRDQLEAALGRTAIGMIPEIGRRLSGKRTEDYMVDNPASGFAEAFRMLWFTMKHLRDRKAPQVLLVTSSLPNEGKSLTALSLARTCATLGMKTLLVDGDVRRSTIAKKIGMEATCSIIDILDGTVALADAVARDPRTPLDVLPGRSARNSDIDLMALSNGAEALFARMRESYDLIVVDSPPVLPVADVQILAQHADQVLFCVRWDSTPRQTAQSALQMLSEVCGNIGGVLLTRVDLRRHAGYGYHDAGYYYSQYRKYYTEA